MNIRSAFTVLLIFGFGIFFFENKVAAQNSSTVPDLTFKPTLTVSGSFAPYSFRAWGKVQNSQQLFLKIGYTHTEFDLLTFRTQLSSEIIVSGLVHYPLDGRNGERNTLYGFGIIPLVANMPLNQNPSHPFIISSVGFIVTHSQFPNIDGARFNFLLGLGAGYQIATENKRSYQLGWKLSHMSNGFIAPENPGIDSVLLFVNFLF